MEHPDPVPPRPLTPDNLDELIVAATDRAYRAQGIGRQTLALLLDLARKHGATHVVASAAIDNRASRRLLVAAGADQTIGADGVEAAIPVSEPMIGIMSREGRMSAPHSASPHPGDQA